MESGVPMIWIMETIMTMILQARIDFLSIYYNVQLAKIMYRWYYLNSELFFRF